MLLGLAYFPAVLAHGGEDVEGMHGDHGIHGASDASNQGAQEVEYPPTYFAHPDHVALLYAHVALMVLAWVLALPVGKSADMQWSSKAKSHDHLTNITPFL
jgi:hypothetical protein